MTTLLRRHLPLSLSATIVVGLAVLCAVRWGAWFGNPPEQPYTPGTTPHRVLLTFGNEGMFSRQISWTADTVLHPSFVELIDTAADRPDTLCIEVSTAEVFASRAGRAGYYVAQLRNLRPGATYRYRAVTGGKASPWYETTLPRTAHPDQGDMNQPSAPDDFSFLYFGDVQDSIGGTMPQLVGAAARRHPEAEFVVFGGDLAERPTDAYWNEAFRAIDSLNTRLPVLAVAGNHEYLKHPIRQLERRFTLTFPYFLQSRINDNHVFTLPYRDAQIYLLDSNRELPYLYAQREWLAKAFAQSHARWNIVVLHHPVYSVKSPTNNLVVRALFADLLNKHADLVLQGHEHAYARMTAHDSNGHPTPPIYTVSHCSPKHYRIEFDTDRFDRFGCGEQHYQTVTLHGDTLSLRTLDARTHRLYDHVDLVKGMHDRPKVIDRGRQIAERLFFTPRPGSKKDAAFRQRIEQHRRQRAEATR